MDQPCVALGLLVRRWCRQGCTMGTPVLGQTNLAQGCDGGLGQQEDTGHSWGGTASHFTHFKLEAVDFDHPEGPEDLSEVGGFITVPRREAEITTWAPTTPCQAPSPPHGSHTAAGGLCLV